MKINYVSEVKMRRFGNVVIVFIISVLALTGCSTGVYNVTDYGATGNGSTSDTAAINDAIAAADAAGGGTVYFPTGTFKSGSIIMKDNITLDISAKATLLATDAAEYSIVDKNPYEDHGGYQDWGHSHWESSLIWGIGLNNIAIKGKGLINGDALDAGRPKDSYGDRAISFKNSIGIVIKDISIYRAGHFAIITSGCNDIDINNVTIDTNRDGINIDCCNDVNIVNCSINAPKDDAICMKSSYCLDYKRPTENVNISNCTVMGHEVGYLLNPPGSDDGYNCGSIKFGTESNGGFKNITITDCTFELSRGFMLATVDGGDIENITIDNIQMTDIVDPPIFLKIGNRARGPGNPPPGKYRNVNISNVTCTSSLTKMSCIISGIPGHYIEDVNLTNINISYAGGGTAADASIVLPEKERGYPYGGMLGSVTPSYGFYVRHAKGVQFQDCDFTFNNNDERPAFVLVDVNGFELDDPDAEVKVVSAAEAKAQAEVEAQASTRSPRSRRGRLYGDWQVKVDYNGRQRESILSFSRDADGNQIGHWISFWGLSELKDVKYENGKLSFVRISRNRQGQSTTSKFSGTVKDGKFSGTISSDRGESKLEGERSARIPRAVGSWEMNLKMGERQFTSTLVVNADKEGKLTAQWQSQEGEHEITDVKYEQRKLTFKRKSKIRDCQWESTFEGTIRRDTLSGVFKSERGEVTAEGKRIGSSLIGNWNLEVTSERGSRKQRLKVNPDMSGMYGAIPIKKVHLKNNKVSFKTVLEFRERKYEMSFEGTLEESKLTGELTTSRGTRKVTGTKVVRTSGRRRTR